MWGRDVKCHTARKHCSLYSNPGTRALTIKEIKINLTMIKKKLYSYKTSLNVYIYPNDKNISKLNIYNLYIYLPRCV